MDQMVFIVIIIVILCSSCISISTGTGIGFYFYKNEQNTPLEEKSFKINVLKNTLGEIETE